MIMAGGIATITLDRPERRNALTPDILVALCREIGHVRTLAGPGDDECRVLLLRGSGKVFCSGFDLDLCRDHPGGSVMRALLSGLAAAVASLRSCDVPVVVAAQGAAIAGGCALLGGADFVVADTNAKFGYPVVRLGVSPAVSIPFLRHAIGDGPARARTLDTALMDGAAAHALGLVSDLVSTPDQVLPAAQAIAALLAAKPRLGLTATRLWLDELALTDAKRGLAASLALTGGEEERRLLPQVWSTRP
ncbi:MAG: enoyl-CoA hydratase/isomerase family protein [Phycisphaerales bacterium]